ncbi:MAG: hypothetical protein WEB00_06740 [Dehalococcoidia bacterium]
MAESLQGERDQFIVRVMTAATVSRRMAFREWIQAELNDLIVRAGTLEGAAEGEIKFQLEKLVEELRDIDSRQLRDAVRNSDEICSQVEAGVYTDCLNASEYLTEALNPFEAIVRRLLRSRDFVEALWGDGS